MSEDDVVEKVILAPQAVKKFAKIEEIAELAAFLAGDAAQGITGSAYSIDGGWTAR
jgi:3-hydroxybutyrate dehydrogenase